VLSLRVAAVVAKASLLAGATILATGTVDLSYVDGLGWFYMIALLMVVWLLSSLLIPVNRRPKPTPVAVRRKPGHLRLAEAGAARPQRGRHRGNQQRLPLMNPPLVPAPYGRLHA